MRRLEFPSTVRVGVVGANRSSEYAAGWLRRLGVEVVDDEQAPVVVVAGDPAQEPPSLPVDHVVVWDYQVGRAGTGYQASAVSGVSWVIGLPGRAPMGLPAEIPEKWCGLLGATLALSTLLRGAQRPRPRRMDVSAADVLRAFADQNAGNHLEIANGWSRNGRVAVEHGGIYPQGFYPCADGFVAIVARSRRDWEAVLAAIGDPPWSREPEMRDPFALSQDASVVDPLLGAALAELTRDELLERALACGATIAPVYAVHELPERDIVREDFPLDGELPLPFSIHGGT